MDRFTFDYNLAIREARNIDNVAVSLEKVSTRMDDALRRLSSHWNGESAAHYLRKGDRAREDNATTARSIRRTAELLREAAEEIRRQEERNASIAATH